MRDFKAEMKLGSVRTDAGSALTELYRAAQVMDDVALLIW